MSGKAYTMREMKAIVEYLTEHRAYNEIKGRKMWMELASSNVTTRTWQSLKETFLKRILPDIHNPYYKLSVTQISSFRQGQDIETRLNNRLQIRSASQETDKNGVEQPDTVKPGNSNEIEDKVTGEDHNLSNLRASTETLLIENCYETAEEIRKDLQSPTSEAEEEKEKKTTKTMRELITYSEPLTPMLQSVIDDFMTDDEEGKMQIVEPEEATDKKDVNIEENVTIEISDSEGNDVLEEPKQTKNTDNDRPSSPDKNAVATSESQELEVTNKKSTTLSSPSNNTTTEKDSSDVKNTEGDKLKTSSEITQNNSASITDTFLPGNQEAFEENLKKLPEKRSSLRLSNKSNVENGRKRASSQDAEPKTKKRILSKLKSISDSEKSAPTNGNIFIQSKLSTVNQTLTESNKTSSNVNNGNFENSSTQKEAADNSQDTIMKNIAENPCLKNVSLYAEQFSTEKYIDSDTSNMEDDKNDNMDKNKNNENIKDKNTKKNVEHEKSDIRNEKSVDGKDKTGDTNKRSNEIEKSSDKNKKSVFKNKSVEDENEQRKDTHVKVTEDRNDNAGHKNKKKIEISATSNEKIEDIVDKKMAKIDNNHKTDNKNKKYDKPSSTAAQECVQENENNVTVLKSYSDSVAESGNEVKRAKDQSAGKQRDSALAHMFGFASGGASRRQRRGSDRRKRTISHSHKRYSKYDNMSSASSEWTSDTGSEFVSSPPRQSARKGRNTRKYLKPRSARILSLDEEGGLFVMYNKKIYPVVKDGKNVKHYANYFPEDDVDPDESYWKLKYVEEKKRTAELTKLLNKAKDNEQQGENSRVPPNTARNNNALVLREDSSLAESTKNVSAEALPVKAPQPNPISEEKKTVKIKFIKNNEEVQLEGHWTQISPVLAHVAQLFQKEPDPVTPSIVSVKSDSLAPEQIVESGKSTPIEEVVEKVNQREKEIAQEIERYHEEEVNAPEALPQTQNNVTKRRGRPRKTSPAVPPSPAKIAKLDVEVSEPKESAEKTQQAPEGQDNTTVTTRRTRTPKKLLAETAEVNQNTIIKTRKSTSRKSGEKTVSDTKLADQPNQDDEIRYKFPSPPPAKVKLYTNKSKTNAAAKNASLRNTKRTTNLHSPENEFIDSIDSMQGYQDSDISPSRICIKRRRKSLPLKSHRKRYSTRYRQGTRHPQMTSDSSNSYQSPRLKTMTFQNSTLTSEIYKSESYRLLMNNEPKRTKTISKLGKIVETSPAPKDVSINMEASSEIAANDNIDLNKENMSELVQTNMDENSSNVSLPTSPVLSIVENISISKSHMELSSSMELDDYPFEDKREELVTLNELLTPNDVTMPLMEQDCGIETSHQDGKSYHYNMSISKTDMAISESLLGKINTVNIQDPSLSETLNVKLRNLLLESAKKLYKDTVNNEKKEVDIKSKSGLKKAKKRSSTPRKRQSTSKQKVANTEPCIVEERVESCSRFGRQSCPPVILISEHGSKETITSNETESAQFLTVKPIREKKKKDIIKVKITKPKAKPKDNFNKQKTNFSDSGINETESEIVLQDDSVELIHNHSDTCLNAHECMGDSIQIVDNSDESIISLNSNTANSDIIVSHHTVGDMFDKEEMFSSDAQDGSDVIKEFDFVAPRQVNSSATVYETPIGTQSSANSIMTEDLSVEIPEEPAPKSNWYLFSEEESSNTNCPNYYKKSEAISLGARLEQIFPITCAVPDLSTITEMSRENGDSKQFSENSRTKDVSNSPNLFDY